MIAIYFWFPLFIFCAFSFVTQSLEIGFLAIFLYYLWQFYSPNSNLSKLKRTDSQEKSLANGQPNSQIRHLQNEPRKFIQNITNIPLSQISLQKWFVVIIPLILFVFLTIFFSVVFSNFVFNLYLSFISLIFYYVLVGIIYLVSQLINKIYNSQNLQKLNQKVPKNSSEQITMLNHQNPNNSSSETPNETLNPSQQKNNKIKVDKIKSNLLSKWHFLAILVVGLLVNLIISFIPLMVLLFRTILFGDSSTTVLIIYLNLLIFGIFFALVFFGIQNRINSILLGMILIISLFWSLGNIYNINTYLNFANFSTCKDFRMLYDRGYLDYFPEKEDYISSSIGEVKKLSDQVEVKISGYFVKYFKVEKIGEISKLEKIKNCLIPNFENKKVILIEEIDRRDPNFPELPNTNFAPLPTDSNFSTPTNPPIYLPPNIAN